MKKTIIPRILTFTLILALFLSSNAIAAKSMLDVKDIGFYLDDFLVLYKDGTVDGTRSTYYCMVDSKDGEVTLAYSN